MKARGEVTKRQRLAARKEGEQLRQSEEVVPFYRLGSSSKAEQVDCIGQESRIGAESVRFDGAGIGAEINRCADFEIESGSA